MGDKCNVLILNALTIKLYRFFLASNCKSLKTSAKHRIREYSNSCVTERLSSGAKVQYNLGIFH